MDAKKNIEESLELLRKLAIERDEIEHRMGQLHLAIQALSNLVPDKAEREGYRAVLDRYRVRTGLTDLIHLALRTFDRAVSAKEIRSFIKNYGSEASTQQNLLQSIYTIVKRMVDNGEVAVEEDEEGDKTYRLVKIGERLAKMGVQRDAANRIGIRMENKFSSEDVMAFLGIPKGGGTISFASLMAPRTRHPNRGIRAGLENLSKDKKD